MTCLELYTIGPIFPHVIIFFMTTDPQSSPVLGNRYRLIHQVGKGGMALVYQGYDQLLERPVAIKLMKQDFAEKIEFRERFKQEARSAANLSHPNIVTVHDYGVDPSGVYIVMEYIAGTDLKSRLLDKGHLSPLEGLPLMIQACSGLGYAHRAGIVHCDVKPHNMLISRDDILKITDFGIARALSTLSQQERPGLVWGSPLYFSPEQALGEPPTPASDVYSLGVVLYELFTGKFPFNADSIEELTRMHQSELPHPPIEINPEIPVELDKIIRKTLSKNPNSRYRTADQLGHVLSELSTHPGVLPSTKTFPVIRPVTPPPAVLPPAITQEDYHDQGIKQPTDWKLIGLELLTLVAVGGLIPLWLFIILKLGTLFR